MALVTIPEAWRRGGPGQEGPGRQASPGISAESKKAGGDRSVGRGVLGDRDPGSNLGAVVSQLCDLCKLGDHPEADYNVINNHCLSGIRTQELNEAAYACPRWVCRFSRARARGHTRARQQEWSSEQEGEASQATGTRTGFCSEPSLSRRWEKLGGSGLPDLGPEASLSCLVLPSFQTFPREPMWPSALATDLGGPETWCCCSLTVASLCLSSDRTL